MPHPTPSTLPTNAEVLRSLLDAALAAAHPAPATRDVVAQLPLDPDARRWIIALGKAAASMGDAAMGALAARGLGCDGGLAVVPAGVAPTTALPTLCGDHPLPGILSFAAAEALGELAELVDAGDEVLVLLSGGTSSLVAAPVPGVRHDDVTTLVGMLLASGADIATVNAVRKRFLRWGAGRLAAALAPARVHVLVVSDVPGDDLATIASGPCMPDPRTAGELRALLERVALLGHLPGTLRDHIEGVRAGSVPETPKPGEPAFATVSHRVIASNAHAVEGASRAARAHGLVAHAAPEPLAGEASACGVRLAQMLLRIRARQRHEGASGTACLVWGGETTVTLGSDLRGRGGRSQELALAAARTLADAGEAGRGIALLAAGTDGRDGPTDAAGAIIDADTIAAVARAGIDPADALARHDAYHALDAAGALVRTGPTGTNVMDIAIAVVG